jgi:hypothetical protein
MTKVLIFISSIVLFFSACQSKQTPSQAQYYLKAISRGTDSIIARGYDSDGKLSYVKSKYLDAVFWTFLDYSKNNIATIRGSLLDNKYGHYLEFYDNGALKGYRYYTGYRNTCSFDRRFSETGELQYKFGNPYVDHVEVEDDSVAYLFSLVLFDSVSVYDLKSANHSSITLKNSTVQPLLMETVIPRNQLPKPIQIIAQGRWTREKSIYFDTLRDN